MKRKIATMLLAFAIFVPALFALTACGDGDTATEPKVAGVSVELADSDYQLIENSITISYGSKLKLDCTDFVVRAVLDNGETKVVLPETSNKAGYIFTSTIPAGDPTPAGEYCLTFAYADFEHVVSVNVLKANVELRYISSKKF